MGSVHYLPNKRKEVETLADVRHMLREIGVVTAVTAGPIMRATRVSPIIDDPSIKRLHQELDSGMVITLPVHICQGRLLYQGTVELGKFVVFGDQKYGPYQNIEFEGLDDDVQVAVLTEGHVCHLLANDAGYLEQIFPPMEW